MTPVEHRISVLHKFFFRCWLPLFLISVPLLAETGAEGWLRYASIYDQTVEAQYETLPANVVALDTAPPVISAQHEFVKAVRGMLHRTLREQGTTPAEDAFVLGTADEIHSALPVTRSILPPSREGFWLRSVKNEGHSYWVVAGADANGVLYGTFHLLEKLGRHERIDSLNEADSPSAPIRWVNQWDNMNGTIERGYAGRSIFFDGGKVREDLTRAGDYARLLASVGLNGCTVNNVNADLQILSDDTLSQVARIANTFRPWGVRLSLSVDLSSPKVIGHLDTFDPLDAKVASWWKQKVDEVYKQIPDFGGFVVKADSEGRPGPSQYGRTPAEAANALARALKPHGGVVLYRGFVYNHHLDWRDLKADRARAGYDNFHELDGKFEENVIVQIKHGPIDFQAREPVSPLFAALRQTNQAIELQITQEYTGQQRHVVYLVPMWKEMLDLDLRVGGERTPVKKIVTGQTFHRSTGGFVGVANVGLDANWLAHPLAMGNLYGFGRLAWNPDQTPDVIVEQWTRLTFGNQPEVVKTIDRIQLASWRTYENYTGPLGAGTFTDIIGVHFGPGIESSERNGWGQWHRADHEGIGMDRTVKTGTGYVGQYPPDVAATYESVASTPDELLLFMHHVPYTYRLHSGKTVIQHIYDTHYKGAAEAAGFVEQWRALHGLLDEQRFEQTLALLKYQAGHAIVWRDAICNWFARMSGIPDQAGRVGNHPNRIEAENMRQKGYTAEDVQPWETASEGKAVVCRNSSSCELSVTLSKPSGWYTLSVQYFDLNKGASHYSAFLNAQELASWVADAHLPSDKMNGHTSTRFSVMGIALRAGDVLRIEAKPDGGEPAPIDYVELTPDRK